MIFRAGQVGLGLLQHMAFMPRREREWDEGKPSDIDTTTHHFGIQAGDSIIVDP